MLGAPLGETRTRMEGPLSQLRILSAFTLSAGLVVGGAGCVTTVGDGDEERDGDEELGVAQSTLRNGTVVTPWAAGSSASHERAIVQIGGCTGTVVAPSWVLSAKHCSFAVGATIASKRPSGDVVRTVDRVTPHPTLDTVMLHVSQAFTDIPAVTPYAGTTTASLLGKTLTCYGYGYKSATLAPDAGAGPCSGGTGLLAPYCVTGSTELRSGALVATAETDPSLIRTNENAAGQSILPGDSGGPCFDGTQLAAVNSAWSYYYGSYTLLGRHVVMPAFRTWFDRVLHPSVKADYDGDGQTDKAFFRPSSSSWYVLRSSTSTTSVTQWGTGGDQPVLGDYDGDGQTDYTVWRPSGLDRTFIVLRSSDGAAQSLLWGVAGDAPVPGDYDGDGKTDYAVWRPSNGSWYIARSSDGGVVVYPWGQSGDVPVPGDYDGDRRTDYAVWRPSNGTWYVIRSADGTRRDTQWGQAGDLPVSGDYDGDDQRDPAVMRRTTSDIWYINPTNGSGAYWQGWGTTGDVPSAGDYNGDTKWDTAFFRPSGQIWYVWHTGGGAYWQAGWGTSGDISAPSLTF